MSIGLDSLQGAPLALGSVLGDVSDGAGPALCGPQLQWCHRRLRATAAQLQRGKELRFTVLSFFFVSFLQKL